LESDKTATDRSVLSPFWYLAQQIEIALQYAASRWKDGVCLPDEAEFLPDLSPDRTRQIQSLPKVKKKLKFCSHLLSPALIWPSKPGWSQPPFFNRREKFPNPEKMVLAPE
jgi:hypothetical protein